MRLICLIVFALVLAVAPSVRACDAANFRAFSGAYSAQSGCAGDGVTFAPSFAPAFAPSYFTRSFAPSYAPSFVPAFAPTYGYGASFSVGRSFGLHANGAFVPIRAPRRFFAPAPVVVRPAGLINFNFGFRR